MAQPYLFPEHARLGRDNAVLHARSRQHRVENYAGPLSIKTVLDGQVAWTIGGRKLVVDRSSFLVAGAGEAYSMDIAEAKPVETCCVFFAPGFVERVAQDITSPLENSLERVEPLPALPYLSSLHTDRILVEHVQSLGPQCKGALAPSAFEAEFLVLAGDLLQFYERIRREAARVPAIRESTRQELFRRLLIGREYMHSNTSGSVSLDAVAKASCLSPFHFHRGFKHAFQQTPHDYLTCIRLDRARRMLESGSQVIEACLEAGFSSPSAFSRLFRSRHGEVPSAVRRKFARLGKKSSAASRTLAS